MHEELNAIHKNQTWILIDSPANRKVIGIKWVYKSKLNADDSMNRLKIRLLVKGYAQEFRIGFSKTFALVVRLNTIKLLLALAAQLPWKIHQLDVKSAFLDGKIDEVMYVE